jgi:hypothetical protein
MFIYARRPREDELSIKAKRKRCLADYFFICLLLTASSYFNASAFPGKCLLCKSD